MRLRTVGGGDGSTGDGCIGHADDDVELLDGLAPDMQNAGNVQGLLTSGRSSVDFGVRNMSYSPSCCLAWLLLRAMGELQGAIDITFKSMHGAPPPMHRQWAPLYKRVEPKRLQFNTTVVQNHDRDMLTSLTIGLSHQCVTIMDCSGHRLRTIHVHGWNTSGMACTEQ